MSDSVAFELSNDEALVLFEFLARREAMPDAAKLDAAEEAVLWKIEATLEKSLVAPLQSDYDRLLREARERIEARR